MLSDVHRKDIDELYKTPIVQQTAFWSIVKRKIGHDTIALNFKSHKSSLYNEVVHDAHVQSDLLVIIQLLNNTDSIAYVPSGPSLDTQKNLQVVF